MSDIEWFSALFKVALGTSWLYVDLRGLPLNMAQQWLEESVDLGLASGLVAVSGLLHLLSIVKGSRRGRLVHLMWGASFWMAAAVFFTMGLPWGTQAIGFPLLSIFLGRAWLRLREATRPGPLPLGSSQ